MNDVVDKVTRSRMMSGIRGKNTRPELVIRSALHARGYRFRLHRKGLPGKPDIVLAKYEAAVFVNGCFWHGHDCHLFKWPSTRQEFWREKIEGNRARDQRVLGDLEQLGWRTARIWECALKGPGRLTVDVVTDRLCSWLGSDQQAVEIRGTR
ncbi:MAG: DNA mismatch endonuclease Vsr [Maricaulis sp.]|uniref:very short patch repair endonuclease n=1 Tax=Maricaulis sp. TaxID=1486257 RepID=UPI001AFEE672|nr:very short patch repair endonuclease [Maricaulis sp.]MBO6729968.1 DNA mismatch endonuclease Vsr [Maricaulis sp.]MBO6878302.1 DNA mismatch endonuclease Vsr [Maricaulis sp.]